MSRRFLVSRRERRGLTLVEILVAAAISLIVILSVVQLFKHSGDIVREGRATIEMAGQIRRAAGQVREDVAMVTVPTTPWPTDATAQGYFEIYEGPNYDGVTLLNANPNDDVFGDLDDVVMFTARSDERPFVGRYNGNTIESNLAEIVIWPVQGPRGEALLHRRTLLIRPDLSSAAVGNVVDPATLANFYNLNDVSVRVDRSTGNLFLNSLSDLTKRENRVAHLAFPLGTNQPFPSSNTFPFILNPTLLGALVQSGILQGNDVLLDHVTSFDVKVYDPIALIRRDADSGRALEPSDPGYTISATASPAIAPIGQGAYVDLGYGQYTAGASRFSGLPHIKSRLDPTYLPNVSGLPYGRTYCTWSSHYERDGINQNGNYIVMKNRPVVDEGNDGIDNDGANGVDDGNELETTPPYPYPLRSVQIKIRIMDSVTQNVRQVTVQNDFLSE